MVRKLSVKHPAAFLRYMRNLRMEQTEREKKEQAYITQLKKNMNPEDVAGLYHLYQKLTEKSYFRTDVGFGFLAELRDYLLKNGYQIDAYTMPQSQANKKVSETHTDAHLRRKYERLCEKQDRAHDARLHRRLPNDQAAHDTNRVAKRPRQTDPRFTQKLKQKLHQ